MIFAFLDRKSMFAFETLVQKLTLILKILTKIGFKYSSHKENYEQYHFGTERF